MQTLGNGADIDEGIDMEPNAIPYEDISLL